ncbi:MAG: 50S ribosomal protein L13 [Candidatus Kapaibacterium sp.]
MQPSAKITRSFRKEDVQRDWWIVDAKGRTVGRIATEIAKLLRGKHKPVFTPHVDTGDFVIVLNASEVELKGKRAEMKEYFRHSGYPGGVTMRSFKELKQNKPEEIIEHAVKGMLPKNRLGRQIFKKLKVYAGDDHPHAAQKPKVYETN